MVVMAVALWCGKRSERRRFENELEMHSIGQGLRPAAMGDQNAMSMERQQQLQQLQQHPQHQVTGRFVSAGASSPSPVVGVVKGVVVSSDVRAAERTMSP
eukprot:COSAG06_NODE_6216_length_3045_cov_2.747794_2_plen_100_part_00